MSMTQPYVYWILDAPFVTVIGLYSNVEGSLDARGRYAQQHFLQTALTNAPADRKLIVAVHHPPFSLDAAHGGTPDILNALDRAFAKSGRFPDAVLSGHVHNYQRSSRDHEGRKIPYVVAGAGGYANDQKSMHKLQKGLGNPALPFQTTLSDVRLDSYNLLDPGFLRLTADAGGLEIEYFVVPFDGGPVVRFDAVRA